MPVWTGIRVSGQLWKNFYTEMIIEKPNGTSPNLQVVELSESSKESCVFLHMGTFFEADCNQTTLAGGQTLQCVCAAGTVQTTSCYCLQL